MQQGFHGGASAAGARSDYIEEGSDQLTSRTRSSIRARRSVNATPTKSAAEARLTSTPLALTRTKPSMLSDGKFLSARTAQSRSASEPARKSCKLVGTGGRCVDGRQSSVPVMRGSECEAARFRAEVGVVRVDNLESVGLVRLVVKALAFVIADSVIVVEAAPVFVAVTQ